MLLNKSPYLLCHSEELTGSGLILQTAAPNYLGLIRVFRTENEFIAFTQEKQLYSYATVKGYRVVIEGAGTLNAPGSHKNQFFSNGKFIGPDIQRIYAEMAQFYYQFKITTNLNYFQKYKQYFN